MRRLHMFAFPLLLVAAVFGYNMKPWSFKVDQEKVAELVRNGSSKGPVVAEEDEQEVMPLDTDLNNEESNVLWKKTLFRPDRTEHVATGSKETTAAKTDYDFELRAVTIVSGKGIAIINAVKKRGRSPIRRTSTRGSSATSQQKPKGQITRRPKTMFKVGHEVVDKDGEKTGWFVRVVDRVKKEDKLVSRAIIQKGKERVELYLDKTDKGSESRKGETVKQAEKATAKPVKEVKKPVKKVEKKKEEDKKKKLMPPPPPPPPPAAMLPPI